MIDHIKVISLDRTPERFDEFLSRNKTLAVRRFPAIDGALASRSDCVEDGLITPENVYAAGALGTALSHLSLWRDCAAAQTPFHICEDDAVFRADFDAVATSLLDDLPTWDLVLWAFNLDWPVMMSDAGIGTFVVQCTSQEPSALSDSFRLSATRPLLFKLHSAAALVAYSISPQGAARMLAACLPIGAAQAPYAANPALGWRNSGLDVEMSRHYPTLDAFVSMPPLAMAPNDQSASTIRGHLAAMHNPSIANRAIV